MLSEKSGGDVTEKFPNEGSVRGGMNIYVGNLSYTTNEDSLRNAFEKYGEVERVNIITDRDTGRPRGFAFVEMPDGKAATDAIAALDGTELEGRSLKVNEAKPKRDNRSPRRPGRDRW